MKGHIIKIEDGASGNAILTIMGLNGEITESRGHIDNAVMIAIDKGSLVKFDKVWNDISKCYYAKNITVGG